MARDTSASAEPKVKKTRWYHQVWQAYQMTRKVDPAVTWIVLAVFVGFIFMEIYFIRNAIISGKALFQKTVPQHEPLQGEN